MNNLNKSKITINNVDINFVDTDIFKYKSQKKYDVIVSNPPYITESEKHLMKKNVLNFEPKLALFVDDIDCKKLVKFLKSYNFNVKSFEDHKRLSRFISALKPIYF